MEDSSYVCTLPESVQKIARDELNENPKTRMSEVQKLRSWILQQPLLIARTDTKTLLRYLRGCKFSQEKARDKIEMYYASKAVLPSMFNGRDPLSPALRAIYSLNLMVPLPGYDSHGRKVILGRLGAWDPEKVNPEDLFKAASMLFDALFLEDEQNSINGFVQVHDMAGLSFKHVAALKFSLIRKVMTVWTEGYPTRPKAVHYINNSGAFDTLFKVFSKFMKDKMKKRIQVHGTNMDALFQHVPKEMFPKEYGGSGPTLQQHTDQWVKRLEAHRSWFLEDEKYRAEKKRRRLRISKKIDQITVEESFRKLEID